MFLLEQHQVDFLDPDSPDVKNPFDHRNRKLWLRIIQHKFSDSVKHMNDVLRHCSTTQSEIIKRLASPRGCFSEREAREMTQEMLRNISERFDGQPLLTSEEINYVWCVGLIAFFMVCGYPPVEGKEEENFLNSTNLCPLVHSDTWKTMESSHRFPSKGLKELNENCIGFILNILDNPMIAYSSVQALEENWVHICFDFYDWYDDDGSPFDLLLQEEYVCNKRQVSLDAYRGFGQKGVVQKSS